VDKKPDKEVMMRAGLAEFENSEWEGDRDETVRAIYAAMVRARLRELGALKALSLDQSRVR
jgi:hypothetical protein